MQRYGREKLLLPIGVLQVYTFQFPFLIYIINSPRLIQSQVGLRSKLRFRKQLLPIRRTSVSHSHTL